MKVYKNMYNYTNKARFNNFTGLFQSGLFV